MMLYQKGDQFIIPVTIEIIEDYRDNTYSILLKELDIQQFYDEEELREIVDVDFKKKKLQKEIKNLQSQLEALV